MQIKVYVTEDEFLSGDLLNEKEPPVIEFRNKDGWTRRVKLKDIDKLNQFSSINKTFLLALKDIVDDFSKGEGVRK